MAWFWIIFVGLLITGFTFGHYDNKRKDEVNFANNNKIKRKIDEFDNASIIFISEDMNTSVALSEKRREVLVMSATEIKSEVPYTYKERIIKLDDILESEVTINNLIVATTNKILQEVFGTLIEGKLGDRAGTINVGLFGIKKSNDEIRNIDIRLLIDDINNPLCIINFLHDIDFEAVFRKRLRKGHSKDSKQYKTVIKQVEKWQGMFDVLLQNRDN